MGQAAEDTREDDEPKDAKFIAGSPEAYDKLLPWMKRISSENESQSELVFALFQTGKEGEIPVDDRFPYDYQEPIEKLCNEILDAAEEEAEDLGGKVKFTVRVRTRGANRPSSLSLARCTFTLVASGKGGRTSREDEDFAAMSEVDDLPNARGQIAQAQRHTEAMAKLAVYSARGSHQLVIDAQQEIIAGLRNENAALKRQYFENVRVYEDLRSMEWARDLDRQKQASAEARKRQVLGMILKFAPMLAARFLGPEAMDAAMQMMGLSGALGPGPMSPPQQVQQAQAHQGQYDQGPPPPAPQAPRVQTYVPPVSSGSSAIEQDIDAFFSSLKQNESQMQEFMAILEPHQFSMLERIYEKVLTWQATRQSSAGSAGTGG